MSKKKQELIKYSEMVHYVLDKSEHEHMVEYVIKVTETDRGELVEMSYADNGHWTVPGEMIASALNTGHGIEWIIHPSTKNQDYLELYEMEIMYSFLNSLNSKPSNFEIRHSKLITRQK